jgi:hypothetical protein
MWHLPHCQIYLVVLVLVVAFSVLIPSYGTNVSILGNIRPHVVNIGALFAFNSMIGRVAKTAIELAVKDVNSDETLLSGTKLVLTMVDSNCNVFSGTAQGSQSNLRLFTKESFSVSVGVALDPKGYGYFNLYKLCKIIMGW